ncbi:hypothetical protein ShzoTeo12_04890 [Shinella zoogloeoides]|nr:hypothetical protein ShzoTeo12_04890 [Shinella zoogloeoides]
MREQRIVQHEVGRRDREHDARHAADDEGHHEADRPQHRHLVADAPAIHGEEPVEHLRPRRDRNDHGGDAEEGVDRGARAHREEVVQPHEVGEDHDHAGRIDHRGIAEEALAAEGRHHLGEDAEGRQHEDVDLRVAPDPDEVDIHHRVAAEVVREEVRADIAVEREQRERGGEDREGRDDQDVRAERGPGEDRHLHEGHARRAHLHDGRDEVDAGQRRADARHLQAPYVIVDPDAGTVVRARQRRIGQPAGARELADEQRHHNDDRAGRRHPEGEVVEEGEGDVARADLQRHDIVHEAGDEGHRHEEDHDHAMGGEDLVVVMRRQIALAAVEGDRLLDAHHDRVGKTAQQHDDGEDDVHDADLLVIDRREPLVPEIAPEPELGDEREERDAAQRHHGEGHDENGLVIGDRLQGKPSEEEMREAGVTEHGIVQYRFRCGPCPGLGHPPPGRAP